MANTSNDLINLDYEVEVKLKLSDLLLISTAIVYKHNFDETNSEKVKERLYKLGTKLSDKVNTELYNVLTEKEK